MTTLSALTAPSKQIVTGDARSTGLKDDSVDLVVTSPPYWQKRDYGHDDQIGQESTPQGYVSAMMECLAEWKRVLRPTGSVFLNVGDTYHKKSLVGIPGRIEAAAVDAGWLVIVSAHSYSHSCYTTTRTRRWASMTDSTRRGPGVVRDAIIRVFEAKRTELTVAELRELVCADLQTEVPASSVRSYLNINTPKKFSRTGRGRYTLNRAKR